MATPHDKALAALTKEAKKHKTKMSFLEHTAKNYNKYPGKQIGHTDIAWNTARGKTYQQAYGK